VLPAVMSDERYNKNKKYAKHKLQVIPLKTLKQWMPFICVAMF
jgi:hypothetical protein